MPRPDPLRSPLTPLLRSGRVAALLYLRRTTKPVNMQTLTEGARISDSTAHFLRVDLEAAGLLSVRPALTHRKRAIQVHLTPKGEQVADALQHVMDLLGQPER